MTTNRLSAAVALAFVSSVPFSALAEAPSVTWRAPLNGATISKTISGSACAVDATSSVGMQRLVFWIGGMQINNDYSSPWNCSLDTSRVRDGNYAMRVDAYSAKGELTQRTINVTVRNSGTTTTTQTTPTNTAPSVSITSPTAGQSVTGGNLSFAANAVDNAGVSRVEFRLDGSLIATDTSAPYSGSRSGIAAGSHTLTATAFDAAGLSSTSSVNFTVPSTTTTTPPPTSSTPLPAPTSGSLDVWFKAPLSGATVSGVLSLDKCYVKGTGVSRVNFSVDGKALNSDTNVADGMSCTLDTRTLANGTHQLMASAVSSTGATRNDVISINVQNSGTTTPPPTTTPAPTTPTPTPTTPPADDEVPPVTSNLPTGGTAVATFHSIGLYFKPSSNPGAAGCKVQYRKVGETAFKPGLAMWYDTRNSECRGSLVNLQPATQYEVQLGNASSFTHKLVATTWSEQFPIAKTVTLPAGTVSQPVVITEGGSASGYVLYVANSAGTTIDVKNAYPSNVTVAAPYVIVRGLTMKGAQRDAVDLQKGAHHVVVEANDISGWGRRNYVNSAGWEIGVDMDSAIRARCGTSSAVNAAMSNFVIQRNRIHDPRYGANSWDWGHPAGPQGVTMSYCGGNHVIRYNDFRSADSKHYLNDAISGEDNFTNTGFPNNDSDIYGNSIQGVMDDGIEAEGGNKNVRIWGNYLNQTGTGIASTVVATGPLYIFRNVYNQSRKRYLNALDSDDRGPFFKAGSINSTTGGGRRYVFHNTALQASGSGAANGLGAGLGLAGNTGQALTNTVSRNNIFHIWKGGWPSISQTSGGASNDVNYDLYNGNLDLSGEANGIKGTPVYASGHGPSSGAGGNYQLAPTSPGFGKALRLDNFNDDVAAPDMGAHQSGKPAMKFGIQ